MDNDWTSDMEKVLENIRINCVILSKEHKKKYFHLKHILQYFRLPVIIISGVNSIVSVGLQPYIPQNIISMITCALALICSIIGAVELYLAIQKRMENELLSQQQYYLLGVDIFKNLTLSKGNRPIPAKDYLEKSYNEYVKLFENSNAIAKKIEDKLTPLPATMIRTISYQKLSSDDEESKGESDIPGLPLSLMTADGKNMELCIQHNNSPSLRSSSDSQMEIKKDC